MNPTAQIINISTEDVYEHYKQRYNFITERFEGLFGLEIRNVETSFVPLPKDLHQNSTKDAFLIAGSIPEITDKVKTTFKQEPYLIDLSLSAINKFINYYKIKFSFKKTEFDFAKPYIMGIINVTPDSFSDGGKFNSVNSAVERALLLNESGADIIDIGGESTRPGSDPVSVDEELQRTIPVIREVIKLIPDCVISIDTTKSEVAKQALDSGAVIVNDISSCSFDPEMINVVKMFDAGLVLMHMKGNPKTMQINPDYKNVVEEVYDFLFTKFNEAYKNGISKIFIDPGIGFGKRVEHNYRLLSRLSDFKSIGAPILIGLSRKSFIGKTLNIEIEDRDLPTAILETASILKSARIIRTHNVQYCRQIVKLLENF